MIDVEICTHMSLGPIRVVLTGAESSGKSLLAKTLASYYQEPASNEFVKEPLKHRFYQFFGFVSHWQPILLKLIEHHAQIQALFVSKSLKYYMPKKQLSLVLTTLAKN